jgi:hypothetical protein
MIAKKKERADSASKRPTSTPQKLHELVVEINRLLQEKERQLLQQSISGTDSASRTSDGSRETEEQIRFYADAQPSHCETRARADAGHL